MNPEERANKVRASYEDAARRHPHNGNIDTLLPPGSVILTPDEVAVLRRYVVYQSMFNVGHSRDRHEVVELLGGGS